MKIALIVPGGVDRSGEVRVIPALLALLRRLSTQHEVHVYPLSQEPQPGEWRLCGATVHNVGAIRTQPRLVAALRREHRKGRFDIVHAIFSGSCGFIAAFAGKTMRVPSLIHVAGGELVALPRIGYGGRRTWYGRLREYVNLRAVDAVTAASAPMIEQLNALDIAARRIPLGVDRNEWAPARPLARNTLEPLRLVHVASLNAVKDQPTLLRALEILQRRNVDFRLDSIGEDTLAGAVQALCKKLGLIERVTFHGFLRQRESHAVVRSAHVSVISSLHEAGPLAMLEAAMLGVPTVGTAVGHIAEWAPAAAVAVPVGNPEALAAALADLASNEERRLSIAEAAAIRALAEDADYTATEFLALYSELTLRITMRK